MSKHVYFFIDNDDKFICPDLLCKFVHFFHRLFLFILLDMVEDCFFKQYFLGIISLYCLGTYCLFG